MHYQNGLRAMGEALIVLGDASRAPKKALPSSPPPPSSPSLSPPVVGRAIIGAIKACSQSSYGAHLAAAALERGLAESELRHSQGMEFLFANLIQPIQDRVGGPVAAAVAKCCLLGVGPLPLYELGSGGNGRGADVDPSSAAAAMSARNKYLVDTLHLDEGVLAAAPELVAGAVLGRLAKLVRSFDADLGPLPLLEQEYLRAYKVARDSAVIKAADALSKRATSLEATAAAAARVLAAAGARKPDADVMPDVLLDDANAEFNRFFEQVDVKLLGKMAESFGGVADASTARVETAYSALQASMDRHHAKELRDTMMLRSLRRIAEGGGAGGAPVPVLAAILDAYEAAVEAKLLKSAADLAAAQAGAAAAAAAAAASAAASVDAVAGPAASAPPACAASVPVAACTNNKNKNSRSDKSTNNKKNKNKNNKNNHPNSNCAGCCSCRGGGARPAAAPAAPAAPKTPGFAPTEPVAYASNYRLFFAHWVSFVYFSRFFFLRETTNSVEKKIKREKTHSRFFPLSINTKSRLRSLPRSRASPSAWPRPRPP